jgi:hypothetical protein
LSVGLVGVEVDHVAQRTIRESRAEDGDIVLNISKEYAVGWLRVQTDLVAPVVYTFFVVDLLA